MSTDAPKKPPCPTTGGSHYAFRIETKRSDEERWKEEQVGYSQYGEVDLKDRSIALPIHVATGMMSYEAAMCFAWRIKAERGWNVQVRLVPYFVEFKIEATKKDGEEVLLDGFKKELA